MVVVCSYSCSFSFPVVIVDRVIMGVGVSAKKLIMKLWGPKFFCRIGLGYIVNHQRSYHDERDRNEQTNVLVFEKRNKKQNYTHYFKFQKYLQPNKYTCILCSL